MKFEQNYRILDWIVAIVSLETNDSSIFHRGTNSETNIIHSYILYENITFYAEQKMIEVDGVRKKIPT